LPLLHNHITVYCPYCTITSPLTAPTAQSLRRVLPLLHNHFAVYCPYCTITSPCTASTVHSRRRVLPLLYNHFAVYCPYCTITSPCMASTAHSLRRVPPLLHNNFNRTKLSVTKIVPQMDSIPEAPVPSLQNRIQLLVTQKLSGDCAVLSGLGFHGLQQLIPAWL